MISLDEYTKHDGLGHEVVEDRPSFDWDAFLENVFVIWVTFTARIVDVVATGLAREPGPDKLEAVTLACYEEGERYPALSLPAAMEHQNLVSREVAPFFEPFDVLVTPTIARPPAPLGELDQNRAGLSAMDWTRQVFAYCPFTPLFNTTGQPAISLPLHWNDEGLPIGVQFVGRFGDEATLVGLAGQLEEAKPWKDRRPPLHAAA